MNYVMFKIHKIYKIINNFRLNINKVLFKKF